MHPSPSQVLQGGRYQERTAEGEGEGGGHFCPFELEMKSFALEMFGTLLEPGLQ